MTKIINKIRNKKKIESQIIIPNNIQYRHEEGAESEKPILLIALFTNEKEEPSVIALDAETASMLSETLNSSPMRMFIRTGKTDKDVMFG